MSEATQSDSFLLKTLWTTKTQIAKSRAAYAAYRWLTTHGGEGSVYRIRFGPMRGFRWRRNNQYPFWYHLGLYEPHVSGLLAAHLRPGDVFWDVGANAGYHTLMASRVVGDTGYVLGVEADPATCDVLRGELALNQTTNTHVLNVAVSGTDGPVTLMRYPNNLQSRIGETGPGVPVQVEGVTLDTLAERHPWPDVVKMDIEGAEIVALPGGERLLTSDRAPRLFLSVHGDEAAEFCRKFLLERGYRFEEEQGFEQMWVALPPGDRRVG